MYDGVKAMIEAEKSLQPKETEAPPKTEVHKESHEVEVAPKVEDISHEAPPVEKIEHAPNEEKHEH